MLNDSQITINIFMTEQKEIENFASNIAANNNRSMNFINIATNINEDDFMNIAATINEANFMNFSQDINDKDVIKENDIIVRKNLFHAEQIRRQTLLKRITSSKDAKGDSNIMKKFSLSRKKLTLKNLSAKFKKKLKNQALKKLRSLREENDMNVKIKKRTYHIKIIELRCKIIIARSLKTNRLNRNRNQSQIELNNNHVVYL